MCHAERIEVLGFWRVDEFRKPAIKNLELKTKVIDKGNLNAEAYAETLISHSFSRLSPH